MTFFDNEIGVQEIVRKAYDFEIKIIEAIENASSEEFLDDSFSVPNPYKDELVELGLWEALNEAVEMKYNGVA